MSKIQFTPPQLPNLLDARPPAELLSLFRDYAQWIPFGSEGGHWADFLFSEGQTPESLAGLIERPELCQGTLPAHQAFLLAWLQSFRTYQAVFNRHSERHRDLYYRDYLGLRETLASPDHVGIRLQLADGEQSAFVKAGTLYQTGSGLRYAQDRDLIVQRAKLARFGWVRGCNGPAARSFDLKQPGAPGSWPKSGMTLFDPAYGVPAQRWLISAAALGLSQTDCVIELPFVASDGVERPKIARLSSGDRWIALDNGSQTATTHSFKYRGKSGLIASPAGLSDVQGDQPVLCVETDAEVDTSADLKISHLTPGTLAYSDASGNERPLRHSFPFGTRPGAGSAIFLAAPEWFEPGGTIEVKIDFSWIGLPGTSFVQAYNGYPGAATISNDDQILVEIVLFREGKAVATPLKSAFSLFCSNNGDSAEPKAATLAFELDGITNYFTGRFDPAKKAHEQDSFVAVRLIGDAFRHQCYAAHHGLAGDDGAKSPLPPPYRPEVSAVRVAFTRTLKLAGQVGVSKALGAVDQTLIPGPDLRHVVLLGLEGLAPQETLSTFVQVRSGASLKIESWQYLGQNGVWSRFSDVVDDTGGLSRSGVIEFTLPDDAGTVAPTVPEGLHWICAIVADIPDGAFPVVEGLCVNGTTLTLCDLPQVDSAHFAKPLAARSISGLTVSRDDLAEVIQPWHGFGGRGGEDDASFYGRAAQLLSHHQRAVAPNDLRLLLLQQFPEVQDALVETSSRIANVIVLPNAVDRDTGSAGTPLLSAARLDGMRAYLAERASPWAELKLTNPSYIGFAVNVCFKPALSSDREAALQQVRQALAARYGFAMLAETFGISGRGRITKYDLIGELLDLTAVGSVASLEIARQGLAVNEISVGSGEVPTMQFAVSAL